MLIVSFDIHGIVVQREYITQGQTVNREFYCDILKATESVEYQELDSS